MRQSSVGIGSIDQVAVVVRDLDAAMERYATQLGIGPWDVYTYGPHRMHTMTFRGRDQPYVMKLALAQVGSTQYELIEPLEGPTTYHEFLDERAEGLHHLGYYVDNIDAEIARMAALGHPLLQSGRVVWSRRRWCLRLFRMRSRFWLHRRGDYPTPADAGTGVHVPNGAIGRVGIRYDRPDSGGIPVPSKRPIPS
jgi:catechol 2,3-dioxygenase-like lactoylglutathione lyase family enzyme